MSEYIIEWGGIGARLKELIDECGSLPIIVKRLRKERLREPIVRCRDCQYCNVGWCVMFQNIVKPDGFCAWGERRES